MSLFAAKQSGMASMFESMIPTEIMESIRKVANDIPTVLKGVNDTAQAIREAQERIERNLMLATEGINQTLLTIQAQLEELRLKVDSDATPKNYGFVDNTSIERLP